jgi:hypothetical protein
MRGRDYRAKAEDMMGTVALPEKPSKCVLKLRDCMVDITGIIC